MMRHRELIAAAQEAKREFGLGQWHTWSWADPAFAATANAIRNDPDFLRKYGKTIWTTHSKRVWRVDLPPELGGFSIAYKTGRPARSLRYMLLPSQISREMVNFRLFEKIGIPVVGLLAGGNVRKNGVLEEAWMMSRFADGYRSGLDFMGPPDGSPPVCTDPETRHDFMAFNMPLIAHLHEVRCYCRSFRPYNILMKRLPDGKLDCVWLDLSSPYFYFLPELFFRHWNVLDLKNFFKCMRPTEEELRFSLTLYLKHHPRCPLSFSDFYTALQP